MFHSYTRACKLAPAACSAAHMLSRGEKLEAWHLNSDGLWIRSALRNKSQVKNSEQAEILKEQALMFKASTLARGHVRVDVCWGVGEWGGVSMGELYNNVHLHFRTYVMLRYCAFSCTFTHTSCYATVAKNWHRQRPQQTSRTLWLKNRAKLLQEGPGSRSDSFVVVKHTDFPFWGNPSIENEPLIWWMKLKICKIPQFWTFNKS